ncbi:type IV pilin [Natronobiforma cellulositropha]|uniref:type IV pilin n=1 Tax=Natronobiforma cellulositropha TaxID=1679076 RepID=UPI0021D5D98C|nr:type IV pilin [Natronobiforma cellulositropha]
MIERTDEQAVNPVIGTVLLVAVVVILAATVGAFALQIADGVDDGPRAAVTITDTQPDGGNGHLVVTVLNLENSDQVTVTATTSGDELEGASGPTDEVSETVTNAGQNVRVQADGNSPVEVRVTAVAERGDREGLVFDQTVTL